MERFYVIFKGRVQGVGFRFFAQMKAMDLNLTGWIKNCYDDSVEMEVQGPSLDIDEFLDALKEGNGFCHIDHIEITPLPIKDEKKFKIKY